MNRYCSAALGIIAILALTACGTPTSAPGRQTTYATPDKAAQALVNAVARGDKAGELKILGPDAEPLVYSGDKVADEDGMKHFLSLYNSGHKFMSDDYDRQILILGHQEWPMPIPLVRAGGGWRFDASAGKEEILNRRIGRNELNVIRVCRTYVEAQHEYSTWHIAHNVHEYAQRFISTPGRQDGLYWPAGGSEKESPLGPLIAQASAEGYMGGGVHFKHNPYHGYYFRILTQQGPHAHGGAKTYLADGNMTGGFALIAYPARYGDSGIMTFIVNQYGIVYQKNLGISTAAIAPSIHSFDPDSSWTLP